MTHSHIALSLAAAEDFPDLARTWAASVKATHDFLKAEHFFKLQKMILKVFFPAVSEIWICRAPDKIAGFIGCARTRVEMLFVHPDFFGRGLGSRLVNHAAQLHGPLQTDVNEANKKALGFYLAKGFAITGRSPQDSLGWPYPLLHLAQTCGCRH